MSVWLRECVTEFRLKELRRTRKTPSQDMHDRVTRTSKQCHRVESQNKLSLLKRAEDNKVFINICRGQGEPGLHRPTGCQGSWCLWKEKEEGAASLCPGTENHPPVSKDTVRYRQERRSETVHVAYAFGLLSLNSLARAWSDPRDDITYLQRSSGYMTEVQVAWSWMRSQVRC